MDSWPLFALALRTPELELRLPRDEELDRLARAAVGRVLAPGEADFMDTDWTQLPSPEFERAFLQFHWDARAQWRPEAWSLQLVAFAAGEPIGGFGLAAERYTEHRRASTGSWLLPGWRGRGLGIHGRSALLALAFDELGAEEAVTSAHPDNAASRGVSLALGYAETGISVLERPGGDLAPRIAMRLSRGAWTRSVHPPVVITGADPARAMFGV